MADRVVNLSTEADFELGSVTVRPSASEIVRDGETVRVEPRVMQVLVALNRRRGRTVSREELIELCWSGASVSDDALVRPVSQLRKLLANGGGTGNGNGNGTQIETIPKVGYRLVVAPSARPFHSAWVGAALAVSALGGAVVLTGALAGNDVTQTQTAAGREIARPLTSMPGIEQWPALSPSGGQFAFVKADDPGGPRDLYVQAIVPDASPDARLRLTRSPEDEHHPVWSPDGGSLAFVQQSQSRGNSEACSIRVISAFGGAAREVARCGPGHVIGLDWSPDGEHLAYSLRPTPNAPGRTTLLHLDSGATREILTPDDPRDSVEELAFSPDGGSLAFTRSPALGVEDLFVYDLASGATRRVTETHLKIHGFDWLPDGSGFVVSSNRGGEFALWRVVPNGAAAEWTPLAGSGGGADEPRVSENGRLVFERWSGTTRMERVSLEDGDVHELAPSTRYQWDARPSPDGERIAFVSDRGGTAEIWVADVDGGDAVALTSFEGGYTHTPRFSPDGSSIAFATSADGNFDVYVVELASRRIERVTDDPGEDFAPAWSPDGRALYFGSTRSGAWQIWKIDVATDETERVTRDGGRVAQLSRDGATLYFVKADLPGLYRLDLHAGAESRIEGRLFDELAPVDWNNWFVLDDSIYYVQRPVPDAPELARYDLETGRSETVRRTPRLLYKSGIWVANDESEIVLTRVSVNEADLMLLEGVSFGR